MGPDPHLIYRRHVEGFDQLSDGPAIVIAADGNTLVCEGAAVRFPRLSELPERTRRAAPGDPWAGRDDGPVIHQIATWDNRPVYVIASRPNLDDFPVAGRRDPKEESEFTHGTYRTLFGVLGETRLALLGRAVQIVHWATTTRYCSRCGSPTLVPETESVARCPECDHVQYPTHAPAMIVGVVHDGRILLAQSPRFKGALHSILAGFVEPGESVEECILREVFEEAGIRVKNVRYFGSQSWPFPHSLMLGFTAEWAAGEIVLDPEELVHADWYAPDSLPQVPSELSISGRIIRWFCEQYGT